MTLLPSVITRDIFHQSQQSPNLSFKETYWYFQRLMIIIESHRETNITYHKNNPYIIRNLKPDTFNFNICFR